MKNSVKLNSVISLCIISFLLSIVGISAQAPQKIDYQGITRNADNSPISNQNLQIRLSILKGSLQENIVYQETHEVWTDDFGLFTFPIGTGEVQSGVFSTINWGEDAFYIHLEIDAEGGNDYIDLGTMELMSVPYALYAENCGTAEKPAHEWNNTSLRFENKDGTWGDYVNLQGIEGPQGPAGKDGTGVNIIGSVPSAADLDANYTGNTGDMFLVEDSGAGHVWNGSAWVEVGQIQGPPGPAGTTKWNGITDIPSGFSDNIDNVEDGDADPSNEIQELEIIGDMLILSENGGQLDLSDYLDNQTLELIDNELSISDGNSVVLPPSPWESIDNDIFYLEGNVGINMQPINNRSLEVSGSIQVYADEDAPGLGIFTESIGIEIFDAVDDGMFVLSAGGNGIRLSQNGEKGISIGNTGQDGIYISNAGTNGLRINQAADIGIEVGTSGSNGMYIQSAGLNGLEIDNSFFYGINLGTTGNDGINVNSAGNDGMHIQNAGVHGIKIGTVANDGVNIFQAGSNGIYINETEVDGIRINATGNDGMNILSAGGDGVDILSAAQSGIKIGSTENSGVSINSTGTNGVFIENAGTDGIRVGSAGASGISITNSENDGIYIFSAGLDGVFIENAAQDGLEVADAEANGLKVTSAGDNGVYIYSAGFNGVEVTNADANGIKIGTTGSDGFHVVSADNDGLEIQASSSKGIRIGETGNDGIFINSTGNDGLHMESIGHDGIYIGDAGDTGVQVRADNVGMYANSTQADNEWGFYTPDKMHATYGYSGFNTIITSIVVNAGTQILEEGDLVCLSAQYGNRSQFEGKEALYVEKLNERNAHAVVGVVDHKMLIEEKIRVKENGVEEHTSTFSQSPDGAQSGDYVSIVVYGMTSVKINREASIKTGDKLIASAESAFARKPQSSDNPWTSSVIGKAMEDSKGKDKIKVLVNCK